MSELITAENAVRRANIAIFVSVLGQMTPDERVRFQLWRKAHEHEPMPGAPLAPDAPQTAPSQTPAEPK